MLRSWAVPKGLPDDARHDRLAVAVDDHDLGHASYEDANKRIADDGWSGSWRTATSDASCSCCTAGAVQVRYALIDTGSDWLVHRTRDQPPRP